MASHPGHAELSALRRRYEMELLEPVIPFWTRHSPDRVNGGFWSCLDRDGSLYDTTKYGWLQGRQVWMLAKLYRTVDRRPEWLELALSGGRFLRERCLLPGGRVPFSTTADGRAVYLQRKIFTECFYVLALAELSRAADDPSLLREAEEGLERIWSWAFDWTHWARRLGREDLSREATSVVRWSFAEGGDREHGGLFYLLDAGGYSPLPLEWSMKLWCPHAEALYAHLPDDSITRAPEDCTAGGCSRSWRTRHPEGLPSARAEAKP